MKNFLLSLFVCLPALAFAQNPTECGASLENPPTEDVVTIVRVTLCEKSICANDLVLELTLQAVSWRV